MLKSGGNNVALALSCAVKGSRTDGLVVCLTAAGGEVDLSRFTAQALGDLGAGILQLFLGLLAYGVQAGGISVKFFKTGHHRLQGVPTDFCGSSIICVNLHLDSSFFYLVVLWVIYHPLPIMSIGKCPVCL